MGLKGTQMKTGEVGSSLASQPGLAGGTFSELDAVLGALVGVGMPVYR